MRWAELQPINVDGLRARMPEPKCRDIYLFSLQVAAELLFAPKKKAEWLFTFFVFTPSGN
jgi:hypothetical protein